MKTYRDPVSINIVVLRVFILFAPALLIIVKVYEEDAQFKRENKDGAGDATIAGFLAAFLRGLSPAEAMTAAVAVGACNVEYTDALSGIKTWDETVIRVQSGWVHKSLRIKD